jgi:hypothetical protein
MMMSAIVGTFIFFVSISYFIILISKVIPSVNYMYDDTFSGSMFPLSPFVSYSNIFVLYDV